MLYLSIDDGETVAPGLLSAVLRAMRASFQRRVWLDAFDSETATLYSWAVVFRFGVPARFARSPALGRYGYSAKNLPPGDWYGDTFQPAALRKALDYQTRVLGGAS